MNGKPIIFVDMDGVLADLFEYARDLHDVDTYHRITKDQWANQLLRMVNDMFGGYCILSSPLNFDKAGSIKGKKAWLKQHITVPADDWIFEHEKYIYAVQADGTPNVLIDDYGVNIRLWKEHGGIGLKYQADEDSLIDLKRRLETVAG